VNTVQEIRRILSLPYQRVLVPDPAGGFTALIREFPGCIAEGETAAEAYEALERTAHAWLEAVLEQGGTVPPPPVESEFSGRVALRLPKTLHARAVACARYEGVSLNTFLVAAIAERVAATRGTSPAAIMASTRGSTLAAIGSAIGTPIQVRRDMAASVPSTREQSLVVSPKHVAV
jgi:predicted HicB family RNase H-like nuclease